MKWLSETVARAINTTLVQAHGGTAAAVRDGNLLGSALARPRNLAAYTDDPSAFDLAASLGYGLVHNHPFVEGNKRTAGTAMLTFLRLNGWEATAPEPELVVVMVDFAKGDLSEEEVARWLATNTRRLPVAV
ncbi:MAG TPA: type II toxin-antitoxin system death-on-curing family toxin [Myxococcota bacterium]|nr:type II toxin-antitoxin system death-on-curing family toxin [Myxococcota bacterium]